MSDITIIIGLGLIGGSCAKALKSTNESASLIGIDPDESARHLLLEEGVLAHAYDTIEPSHVAGATMIIIATPPHHWDAVRDQLRACEVADHVIITDVGSVKSYALECFGEFPKFVAAHPIAGSEFSGAAYATDGLFHAKRVICCPITSSKTANTDEHALQQVSAMWESFGAVVTTLDAQQHDMIYAHVSHLPQLLSYAMAYAVLQRASYDDGMSGQLRLAGSSPDLWLGIVRHNAGVMAALESFLNILNHMLAELRSGVQQTDTDKPDYDVAARLIPRIIASCLIGAVTIEEKKRDIAMARYAGSGFADMSAPAMTPPEDDLALISEHAHSVIALLEAIEEQVRALLLAIKKEDWHTLGTLMYDAQMRYVQQLH